MYLLERARDAKIPELRNYLAKQPDSTVGQLDPSDDDAYWRSVLRYCRDGNLQAVFDEHLHHLAGAEGIEVTSDTKLADLADKARRALAVRGATYRGFDPDRPDGKGLAFFSRFALRYGGLHQEAEDARLPEVRAAFNSGSYVCRVIVFEAEGRGEVRVAGLDECCCDRGRSVRADESVRVPRDRCGTKRSSVVAQNRSRSNLPSASTKAASRSRCIAACALEGAQSNARASSRTPTSSPGFISRMRATPTPMEPVIGLT